MPRRAAAVTVILLAAAASAWWGITAVGIPLHTFAARCLELLGACTAGYWLSDGIRSLWRATRRH